MKVPISPRLKTCCDFIAAGSRVADVGTDHGYLPIYLLQNGLASHVIATDLREKPLEKAKRNSEKFGVSPRMTFFCTPGLRGVSRDFDTLVCAGMGADTIISVLNEAPWLRNHHYKLVLQCQSSVHDLRHYLWQAGWRIEQEVAARDGKFIYTVMEVTFGDPAALSPGQEYISPALLRFGGEIVEEYIVRCISGLRATVAGIARSKDPLDQKRLAYFQTALLELEEQHGDG